MFVSMCILIVVHEQLPSVIYARLERRFCPRNCRRTNTHASLLSSNACTSWTNLVGGHCYPTYSLDLSVIRIFHSLFVESLIFLIFASTPASKTGQKQRERQRERVTSIDNKHRRLSSGREEKKKGEENRRRNRVTDSSYRRLIVDKWFFLTLLLLLWLSPSLICCLLIEV